MLPNWVVVVSLEFVVVVGDIADLLEKNRYCHRHHRFLGFGVVAFVCADVVMSVLLERRKTLLLWCG